jgi:hypothetical protein
MLPCSKSRWTGGLYPEPVQSVLHLHTLLMQDRSKKPIILPARHRLPKWLSNYEAILTFSAQQTTKWNQTLHQTRIPLTASVHDNTQRGLISYKDLRDSRATLRFLCTRYYTPTPKSTSSQTTTTVETILQCQYNAVNQPYYRPGITLAAYRHTSSSCFVFGRSQAQISARKPAILNDISSWFSSLPPGECWDSALKLDHYSFLANPFQFIHLSPFIRRYIVLVTEKASQNKIQINNHTCLHAAEQVWAF